MTHEDYMRMALDEAELASREGNAPFSCIVVNTDGAVLLREHDRVKEQTDPTAHGEINAIRTLCKQRGETKLRDCTFYTSSEPCTTCMSGLIKAEVPAIYYGAKTEATASLPISVEELASRANHVISVTGGILADECLKQRNRLLN